jgi:hypothetical protein
MRPSFPVWCKGSIGDFRSSGAGSTPATGSITLLACTCVLAALIFGVATASAEKLPDGRVYEMVTPAENQDANVYAPTAITQELNPGEGDTTTRLPFKASVNGDSVAYAGDATISGMGSGGYAEGNQYLATRLSSGSWSQSSIQPLGVNSEGENSVTGVKSAYYQAFSSDLSVGILQSRSAEEPALAAGVPVGYGVLYTHSAGEAGAQPLFTTTPPDRSEEEFGTRGIPKLDPAASGILAFAGASAGLSQSTARSSELLFEANDALTANAVDGGVGENNLYVSVGGRLSLVNVLPNGVGEPDATFGAPNLPGQEPLANEPDFSRVISGDGSRIFWTDLVSGELFVRLNATRPQSPLGVGGECTVGVDACTVEVDAAAPGAEGASGGGRYWTASSDGSKVFFTDENRLTVGSTAAPGEPDLYVYEVESGRLTDLTVDSGEAADVQGVIGASEDGSRLYFAADGVLASNENSEHRTAQAGQPNVYLFEDGTTPTTTFIATLSPYAGTIEPSDVGDAIATLYHVPPNVEVGDLEPGVGDRTAEVSPGGGALVFMSNNQGVGGYAPEFEGKPLEEVYVYEAEAEGGGAGGVLFCASCAASHKQPELKNFLTEGGLGAFLPPDWSLTSEPQWMSEDGGRVFFDSIEPLVAADTNGKPDVYEWERDGVGSCGEASGCIYLLSGGTSQAASWLIGVSGSGNDVFIVSRAQLTPEDHNETYNVFDARVGGVEPVLPPACSGTGCQGVPATPPTFATPASVTFNGVGNFPAGAAETNPAAVPKAKVKAKSCRRGYARKKGRCARVKKRRAKKK